MQLWLYLDFPYLQLDTLFAEQTDQPLIIVEQQHCNVIQANQAALEQGIKPGMGLGSASALSAQLEVHPYQPESENKQLLDLAQWLYLITSDIVLFPPHGILLKATGMLTLYQGLDNYWQAVSQHLACRPLRYRFASGFSPLSAMLLAKSGYNQISDDKSALLNALHTLPITATGLESKQIEALQRIGVCQLKTLFELPMAELARRFNIDLVNYVGRLLGQFKHPLDFFHPPAQFDSQLDLLYEIDNIQWLIKPLTILLQRLESFLLMRNQVAYELRLSLHQRSDDPELNNEKQIFLTSAIGEYRTQGWLKLAQLTFESLRLDAAVQSLQLRVSRAGELPSQPDDLFAGQQGALAPLELISLLQAKLGSKAVTKVAMSDDPRPEKTTYHLNATENVPLTLRRAQLRPSLLLAQPEPLADKVSLMHGPERLVTGWWDNQPISRDYYIARSVEGRWLWIFRDLNKRWFLHGQFS